MIQPIFLTQYIQNTIISTYDHYKIDDEIYYISWY